MAAMTPKLSDSFDKGHKLNGPGRPVMATIITADLDASLSAYTDALGYKVIKTGTLCEALAVHFGLETLTNHKMATLAPPSGAPVFLSFIEALEAVPPVSPKAGWFALELCVQDVDVLYNRLTAGDSFTPFAKPMPLGFTDKVYPMQCRGPSGEILYLNEVRGNLPGLDMPIAECSVDHLFIDITSAPNMDTGVELYSQLLNMDIKERHEIPYKTINRVHGLPLQTLHKLVTLGGHNFVSLEVDQWPKDADAPDLKSKDITEGIFMVSFSVDEISKASKSIKQFPKPPYNGAKSLIGFGPAGERVELISLNESDTQ